MPILSFTEGKIPKELSAVKEVPEGKFWKFEIQKLGVQIGKNKIKQSNEKNFYNYRIAKYFI